MQQGNASYRRCRAMAVAAMAVALTIGCAAPMPEAKRTFKEADPALGSIVPTTVAAPTSSSATSSTVAPPTTAVTPTAPGEVPPVPTTKASAPLTLPTRPGLTTTTKVVVEPDMAAALAKAGALIDAWAANDRAAAAQVANPDIINTLFAKAYDGPYEKDDFCGGGVGNYLCNYQSRTSLVQLWVAHEPGVTMIVRGINILPRS